jgi:PilZ domain
MRALVKPSDFSPATPRKRARMPAKTEGVMEERRKVQRHRTLKAGTITVNGDGGFDCRVRNLSPAGACLEVASQLGIPDDFVLVVEADHARMPCHVIWRTATRLGVAFNG